MKMLTKKIIPILAAVLLLFVAVISSTLGAGVFAYAAGTYSDVLTDLRKDDSFRESDYPAKATDYSLQVIQIAESSDGELFVYTYQPCQKVYALVATEMNMSLSESVDGTKLYMLTLLSNDGVFCKYKVKDFAVSDKAVRYYNITSIYRKWLKGVDDKAEGDNTKSAVAFKVGKLYTVTTENDTILYRCEKRDTIEILNPYAGYLRYTEGFGWHKTACDSHYVAFSTDIKIDFLYEAELEYMSVEVESGSWGAPSFGERIPHHITLTDDEEYRKDAKWWLFGESAEYCRIQTAKEFVANENLSDSTKSNLQGKEWVLRFTETDYTSQYYPSVGSLPAYTSETYTRVYDVTVLRLKFKSAGKVYNLGAVSDKVTEGSKPGNEGCRLPEWAKWLIAVLALILLVVILASLPYVVEVVLWVLILPVRLVQAIIEAAQASKHKKE